MCTRLQNPGEPTITDWDCVYCAGRWVHNPDGTSVQGEPGRDPATKLEAFLMGAIC